MPYTLFTEEEEAQHSLIACIAFAALINEYGKPIEVKQQSVDNLPEHFRLSFEDIEGGRRFFVTEDERQ